ncbi:ubiquinone anaerobic biosynthesis accessory factor UbiT [Alcaligenes sp. SDU_A2]|uniref:ubiquinone anaerobic biosynthesis accessory factor UbiT n=1 Tax=Alcaligenes sp. SDU_A2 TaxID=3136634 RepID=UPI00311E9FA7
MTASTPRLPLPLASVLEHLPRWPGSRVLASALNVVMAPHLPDDVGQCLQERRLRLQVIDARLEFDYSWRNGAFYPLRSGGPAPDLTLRANAWDFYQLLQRKEDPDTLFFNRRLLIEGDTELGLMVKNTLDSLDPSVLQARIVIPQLWQAVRRSLLGQRPVNAARL